MNILLDALVSSIILIGFALAIILITIVVFDFIDNIRDSKAEKEMKKNAIKIEDNNNVINEIKHWIDKFPIDNGDRLKIVDIMKNNISIQLCFSGTYKTKEEFVRICYTVINTDEFLPWEPIEVEGDEKSKKYFIIIKTYI